MIAGNPSSAYRVETRAPSPTLYDRRREQDGHRTLSTSLFRTVMTLSTLSPFTLFLLYFFLSMKRRFHEAFHFCRTGSRRPSSAAASKKPTSLAPAGSLYERCKYSSS